MHLDDIKIVYSFVIKMRGKILVTDLPFTNENFKKANIGDTINYEDVKFEIVSVEALYHGNNPVEHGSVESVAFFVK